MDETTQRGVETAATAGGPEVKLMARPEAGLGTLLRVTLLTLAVLVMAGAAPATAQEEGAEASQEAGQDEAGQDEASAAQQAPPPAPPTCEAPEHAEFDFWVGEWDVYRQIDGWRESRLGRLWRPKYFNEQGIAIHGYENVPPYPASHGCVRVTIEAMNHLWETDALPIHTTVLVY